MTVYSSTLQSKLLSSAGVVTGILLVCFGSMSLLSGSLAGFFLTLLPGGLLLYMLAFVSPWEVRVHEEKIEIRALLRKEYFSYSQIREVSRHYSTTAFNLVRGSGKGMYYYSVKIKNRPMGMFMFGGGIQRADELYEYLRRRISGRNQV